MAGTPVNTLQTRGSLFDAQHQDGILIGYEMADRDKPVVDIIRKKADGTITRQRCTLAEAIEALSKITHG